MSRSGVPSRQSRPRTRKQAPSMPRSSTTETAIGFGRAGERSAKVPRGAGAWRGCCATRFRGARSIQ